MLGSGISDGDGDVTGEGMESVVLNTVHPGWERVRCHGWTLGGLGSGRAGLITRRICGPVPIIEQLRTGIQRTLPHEVGVKDIPVRHTRSRGHWAAP